MKPIQNPPPPDIGPNSSGDAITNLQDALLLLLEKGTIRVPGAEQAIRDGLRRERLEQVYGDTTLTMV
jgi:hypothetical protein